MTENVSIGNLRNRPCYCGKKLKFKNCHLYKDQGFTKTRNGWSWKMKDKLKLVRAHLGSDTFVFVDAPKKRKVKDANQN